jgi:carbon monoxide dehydrogenase subunit G
MITVARTVRTKASLEAVWAYLSDFTNAEQWDPGTVTCKRVDAGPIDVGATYENVSEFRGRKTTLQYTVETFAPAQHLVLRGENKTVQSFDDMTFAGSQAGTELTYEARFTFKGLARLAEPLLHRPLNKLADDTEASLQKHLDQLA